MMVDYLLNDIWKNILHDSMQLPSFAELQDFVSNERIITTVYPPKNLVFNAFNHTPFEKIKVVILGQDPYHGENEAHGLSFSVPRGVKIPPSLRNIYKELNRDLNMPIPNHGNLEHWAEQGVFLLNATLTVRANQAGSHQRKGWEVFTDAVIKKISENREGIVFLLWGKYAQAKECLIDSNKHLILKSVHPSPLSAHRGFIGCNHFSATNQYLISLGKEPIDWNV